MSQYYLPLFDASDAGDDCGECKDCFDCVFGNVCAATFARSDFCASTMANDGSFESRRIVRKRGKLLTPDRSDRVWRNSPVFAATVSLPAVRLFTMIITSSVLGSFSTLVSSNYSKENTYENRLPFSVLIAIGEIMTNGFGVRFMTDAFVPFIVL